MKSLRFLAVATLGVFLCQTAPLPAEPPPDTNASVNYVIKVLMKSAKGDTSSLQVTTVDGSFELDTLLDTPRKNSVKINNADIPTTLKLSGTLTIINGQKGRLKFFLGRTVPYVTSTFNNGSSSSYSQLSVGLASTFVVTFGRPLVIQVDDSGEVSVLVIREEN
jgi:hypothetical protein